MTYEELGAVLRSEREKRHLDIDDIAGQLKISPRHLRALESGDIAALPHPAYAKGFIRSYGNFLGINSDEIQQVFDQKQPVIAKKKQPRPKSPENGETRPESRRGGAGLIFFILLCAICGGIYYAWDTGALTPLIDKYLRTSPETRQLPSADVYMAARDAAKAEKQSVEKSAEAPATPVPESVTAPAPISLGNERAPRADPGAIIFEKAPEKTPPAEEKISDPDPVEKPAEHHKLIITAIEECWIHSNADKTDTRQFSLRKGDTFALTFGESLELKLGNAGGVRLRYDGSDLPPPGTSGQVKTITFPPKTSS